MNRPEGRNGERIADRVANRLGDRPENPFGNRPEAPPGERSGNASGEPVFAEPWEAQAFGLVAALHERGLFAWEEWSAALAAALGEQDAGAKGGDYYRCWLAALEDLLAERGLVPADELDEATASWQRAAHATPHGAPILLENDPGPPDRARRAEHGERG